MKFKTSSVKNGQKHVITNRDNIKHLKHFINDHWRYSPRCKGTGSKNCIR